jgi:Zn-dependent peptidase ImmA (M78 family)
VGEKRLKWMRIGLGVELAVVLFLFANIYMSADGVYSKEVNIIGIFPKDNSVDRQLEVAAHEIGHYVYYKQMTQEQRDEYEKIFNDSNMFVSEYSKTNVYESFAEEFAARITFIYSPDAGSKDKRKFFEENVNWDFYGYE